LQLRMAIFFFALGSLALTVSNALQAVNGNYVSLAIDAFLVITAVYLWRLRSWARKLTQVLLALIVIVAVGGSFNPFFALDYGHGHGGQSPNWGLLMAIIGPFVAALLWCYGVLEKHKNEFR
ncbi:MAG: hypothetical protein ACREUY_04490, partial [Burkholderiales bacterium]